MVLNFAGRLKGEEKEVFRNRRKRKNRENYRSQEPRRG